MRIVVTGGDGFIGRNLRVHLRELGYPDVVSVTGAMSDDELRAVLSTADFVFHLAGANRPADTADFTRINSEFTATVCTILAQTERRIPVVFASSTQATLDNPYGRSKRAGEGIVEEYGVATGSPFFILRLTNVFGKWSRPNYNSVIATFCHNMARGLPIAVNDSATPMTLLYIDDAVTAMIGLINSESAVSGLREVGPTYVTTLGEVVAILKACAANRKSLLVPPVGSGLTRALHATYLSFLPPIDFAYTLTAHSDRRGSFVEMLKTHDSGQVSYFTAPAGVTRGDHYHHTKNEKFLVIQGTARFGFRHLVTGERHDVIIEGSIPRVVETAPGWVHNITNIGEAELIVMLWANEIFDPKHSDTIAASVEA